MEKTMGSCRVHVDLIGGAEEEQWTWGALGLRAGQLNVACVSMDAWRRYYGSMTFWMIGLEGRNVMLTFMDRVLLGADSAILVTPSRGHHHRSQLNNFSTILAS